MWIVRRSRTARAVPLRRPGAMRMPFAARRRQLRGDPLCVATARSCCHRTGQLTLARPRTARTALSDDRLEDGLDSVGELADHLEDLAGRRLLLERAR